MIKMMVNYEGLVADLIQELIDFGYDEKKLIWILTKAGMTPKQIKDWYGIPYGDL